MHDTNMFLRMPASGSAAEQPQNDELLHRFDEEREVKFKEETYLVRDNGAVWRRSRVGARRRKFDEVWTFGVLNRSSGYLVISDHVVHRVVAAAYHGEPPSTGHVVDHIDTNRHNNRAENLRWVTRLENILLNPVTRARIEFAYGSLEAFFENAGVHAVANWDWMRTVTKEEAAQSLARLRKWAEEGRAPTGGALGDWVFAPRRAEPKSVETKLRPPSATGAAGRRLDSPQQSRDEVQPTDTPSLTAGAFQRNWRTPTEFPLCPETIDAGTLDSYLTKLQPGVVFARNRYGESCVVEAAKTLDGALSVVCATASGVKEWSVAKVYLEDGRTIHESGGTFFTREGATKQHLRASGVAFDEALYESIDDYA